MTTPLAKISQAALLYFHELSSPFLIIAPSIIPAASHLYHGKYYEAFTSVFTYTVVGLFSLSTAIMLNSKINILDDCATTHCILLLLHLVHRLHFQLL